MLADSYFSIPGDRLPLLIKRHDDDGRAIAPAQACLLEELFHSLLEANRVDNRLALHALEPGLDDLPFGAVDHDRHLDDVGLGGQEVEEARHGLLAVEQIGIHVNVENVSAAFDLLAGHDQGGLVIPLLDQAGELA